MPVFWAGKALSPNEELSLRRTVALLRRLEDAEDRTEDGARSSREDLELFLPENIHKWTPDELELAAHNGPWFEIGDVPVG